MSERTHFGDRTVPLGAKQGLVDEVFHAVAARYDLMNDLMSFGLHRAWKDALISQLNPNRARPHDHLDVAGGTGDVAFRVLDAAGSRARAIVLDINEAMLAVGRERAATRALRPPRINFVRGNAEALPFEARFDAVTIAFGIRNVPRIEAALGEFHRSLRRGGHLLVLEFAPVDTPILDRVYEAYSARVIPALGRVVAGDSEPYRYLVESIRRFPRPERFAGMIEGAGFRRVGHRALSGGIVNIHSGWKL